MFGSQSKGSSGSSRRRVEEDRLLVGVARQAALQAQLHEEAAVAADLERSRPAGSRRTPAGAVAVRYCVRRSHLAEPDEIVLAPEPALDGRREDLGVRGCDALPNNPFPV